MLGLRGAMRTLCEPERGPLFTDVGWNVYREHSPMRTMLRLEGLKTAGSSWKLLEDLDHHRGASKFEIGNSINLCVFFVCQVPSNYSRKDIPTSLLIWADSVKYKPTAIRDESLVWHRRHGARMWLISFSRDVKSRCRRKILSFASSGSGLRLWT